MDEVIAFFVTSWRYAMIPVIRALIGWGTNVREFDVLFYSFS